MSIAPSINETEFKVAEVLGLYAQLHKQMSDMAYRLHIWTRAASGLDWENADLDSREELELIRGELRVAGYLDESDELTAACGIAE